MEWDEFKDESRPTFEPPPHLDAIARTVIGAAIEVHRVLGPGYLESVYEEALWWELNLRGIAVARQVEVAVDYKGHPVGKGFIDLLVGDLIIELKACDALAPVHKAQVISYLKATGKHLALLINFNVAVLKDGIRRVIYS